MSNKNFNLNPNEDLETRENLGADFDIDAMMNNVVAPAGVYSVVIDSWTKVDAVLNLTEPDPKSGRNTSHLIDPSRPANDVIAQAHLRLSVSGTTSLNATNQRFEFNVRLYPRRFAYFMKAINAQFDYTLDGYTLTELLEYLQHHAFDLYLTYDPKYGEQFDFRTH